MQGRKCSAGAPEREGGRGAGEKGGDELDKVARVPRKGRKGTTAPAVIDWTSGGGTAVRSGAEARVGEGDGQGNAMECFRGAAGADPKGNS